MQSGVLTNEETIVPGSEKSIGSSIEGHDPEKAGVPESWFATSPIATSKAGLNSN